MNFGKYIILWFNWVLTCNFLHFYYNRNPVNCLKTCWSFWFQNKAPQYLISLRFYNIYTLNIHHLFHVLKGKNFVWKWSSRPRTTVNQYLWFDISIKSFTVSKIKFRWILLMCPPPSRGLHEDLFSRLHIIYMQL